MKNWIQILIIFIVFSACVGCISPPEFSKIPSIGFEKLKLTDTASLVLTFSIQDGDGDLGLSNENEDLTHIFEPFHAYEVICINNNKTIKSFIKFNEEVESTQLYSLPITMWPIQVELFKGINSFGGVDTEVVTILAPHSVGTIKPINIEIPKTYHCENFEIISMYKLDSVFSKSGEVLSTELVEYKDTIFVKRNENHFNIFIDFLVEEGEEFKPFELNACDPGFNARFPIFDPSKLDSPLDGSINYVFFSSQFATENSIFIDKKLKIRFYIYDRALNKSNIVETPEFMLLDLRKGDLIPN